MAFRANPARLVAPCFTALNWLSDRIKRIEMIGKHVDVKAFVERREVTGKDGAPIESVMVFNPVGNDDDGPG